MADRAATCVECERRGCPTEGMTLACSDCGDIVCAGHVTAHIERTGCSTRFGTEAFAEPGRDDG